MRLWQVSIPMMFLVSATACAEHANPYGDRAEVTTYIESLVDQHNFARDDLEELFDGAQQRQDIIKLISRPAEKAWTWGRYRSHLVDLDRIDRGVQFWADNTETLMRAAEQYGVAPEYIVAILGIETRYGRITGGFRVLDALTTLGFDYPPRSKFFRKELTEFLLLAREEGKDPKSLKGSYAGAMGYGQFIPSSYRHYAVDFDADGVRDIWQNPVDAIGSIANYFAAHKWRGEALLAVPVELSDDADIEAIDKLANTGLELKHVVEDLQGLGIMAPGTSGAALDPQAKAALFKLETEQGFQYRLGLHDFYVITRYNRSHLYAFAVHELSQAIKAKRSLDLASH